MSRVKEALASEDYGSPPRFIEPTFCRDCDNVVDATRKQSPTRWLCRMHPVRFANGFIDPEWWVENEPFLMCRNVNAGSCPVFKRRRDGQKEIGL